MKKSIIIGFVTVIFVAVIITAYNYSLQIPSVTPTTSPTTQITNFEECAAAGNPIMESYPARCSTKEGQTFTQDIGNELEQTDMIVIGSPRPGAVVSSPLKIEGKARGNWFFEASFPIKLLDEQGKELATGVATDQGEWMTAEFVPFEGELIFTSPIEQKGTLILMKDNPSGLPENDAQLVVPVTIRKN